MIKISLSLSPSLSLSKEPSNVPEALRTNRSNQCESVLFHTAKELQTLPDLNYSSRATGAGSIGDLLLSTRVCLHQLAVLKFLAFSTGMRKGLQLFQRIYGKTRAAQYAILSCQTLEDMD